MKIKRLLILIMVFSLAIMAFSCKTKSTEETEKKETIKISGSSTCLPLIEVLADEFMKENPDIKIVFEPGVHSSGGIKGVSDSILDIGSVSRELKEEEKKLGLTYHRLSDDGLAIGISKEINIDALSTEQVKKIYSGAIRNWSELGGPDRVIVVLDRNEDESAKIILRQYILGKDLKVLPEASNLYFESDMIDAIKVAEDAIGYFSLGYAISTSLDVNLVKIDGVEPTVENILNKEYKIVRPLGFVVKEPKNTAKKFVDFMLSKEAEEAMKRKGFAPAQ